MIAPNDPQLDRWGRQASRFERSMRAAASGAWQDAASRRLLWQAGAVVTSRSAMAIAIGAGAGAFVFSFVQGYFAGDVWQLDARLLAVGFAGTVLMTIVFPAVFTNSRRQFYSMELLWPVSRADWVRDWFVMSANDLAIPIALTAAGVCGGWWFNVWPILPPAHWLPLGVIFVGLALTIRAAELWQRTHRRTAFTVARLLAAMAGGAAFALALVAWMLAGPQISLDPWLRSLPRLWAVALGILLIAGAVTYTAHRRWLSWEVAA